MTDTERLDWAERNPAEFLAYVLGNDDGSGGLEVTSAPTGRALQTGAMELSPPRWDLRSAIDTAAAMAPNAKVTGAPANGD